MKKLFFVWCGLFLIASCTKDKIITFDSVSYTTIKSNVNSFSADPIPIADAQTEFLKPGTIIFFETTGGNFGKMAIKNNGFSAPHNLVFDMVLYDSQGVQLLTKQDLSISLGYLADLDQAMQTAVDGNQSFYWSTNVSNEYLIIPDAGGKFYVFLKK